jgi:hypothetical protein
VESTPEPTPTDEGTPEPTSEPVDSGETSEPSSFGPTDEPTDSATSEESLTTGEGTTGEGVSTTEEVVTTTTAESIATTSGESGSDTTLEAATTTTGESETTPSDGTTTEEIPSTTEGETTAEEVTATTEETPSTTEVATTGEQVETTPSQGGCLIDAIVQCQVDDDTSCSSLSPLSADELTCVLSDGPTELGWIYTGNNCGSSQTDFECTDVNGGPNQNPFVNIVIRNSEGEQLLQELGVSLDDSLVIPMSGGPELDGEISITIFIGGDETQDVVQTITGIPTGCNETDDLTLGNSYGALDFVSYSDGDNLVQAYQPVEWRYSVINTSSQDVTVTEVTSITAGDLPLTQSPDATLEPGESFTFSVPSDISLITEGSYTGVVVATATSGDKVCTASETNTVTSVF